MKKFAIIVYCFYGNFLVSGIQLNQVLPTQPCPCNTYQESLNIPALLQQANVPQQLIQQPQIFDIYKQPINNNPYPQQILIQNDLVAPYKQQMNIPNKLYQYPLNQQTNPITDQLSQLYMNKILSNPMVQGILDSNIRLYNTPFLEMPNQLQGNVLLPQGNVPHVVNNYFILPPELLQTNEEINSPKYNHGHRTNKNIIMPLRENANRRKQSHKQADITDLRYHSRRMSNGNDYFSNQQNKRGKLRPQNDHHNVRARTEEDNDKRGTRRKQNRNLSGENKSVEKHQHAERNRDGRTKDKRIRNGDKEILATDDENLTAPRSKQKSNYNTDEHVEVTESKKRKDRKKNSRDDEFIEDFRKKFPGIPEEVIKSLLSYLRRQLKNQQLGQSPVYHPDVTFPLQFEQLFPHLKKSHIDFNNHNNFRKRRPNRRLSNQRQNKKNKPKILIDPTTPASTVTDAAVTKSETTLTSNLAQQNTDNFVETTTFESTTIENENNINVNSFLTDDYYPNFVNDNNNFGSDEIQIIRNHRDNRYHYTTDRNNEFEITRDVSVESVLIKPNNNDHEKEIATFRMPPLLESPDFRTKQIKKAKPRTNHYKDIAFEKSSTYSDIKTTPTKDVKDRLDKFKKSTTDIETVFAHSKVVKYGKNDDVGEENETPIVTYYIPDNMQYEEDGKTVVIAKSIPPDYFW